MRTSFRLLAVIAVLSFGFATLQGHAEELTETRMRELQEQINRGTKQAWQTIPWKIAMLDAQETAAGQRKPIFVWAMDGHPLGCT